MFDTSSVWFSKMLRNGERKKLNFGHTVGHALEMQYELSHGQAISLGMVVAAQLSEKLTSFQEASLLRTVLSKYELPVDAAFSPQKVLRSMKMDKKRLNRSIDFILLKAIGQSEIRSIPLVTLQQFLNVHA